MHIHTIRINVIVDASVGIGRDDCDGATPRRSPIGGRSRDRSRRVRRRQRTLISPPHGTSTSRTFNAGAM